MVITNLSNTSVHWNLEGSLEPALDKLQLCSPKESNDAIRSFKPKMDIAANPFLMKMLEISELLPNSSTEKLTSRGTDTPCKFGLLVPIVPSTSRSCHGCLLLGIDPRFKNDENYHKFVALLAALLGRSLETVCINMDNAHRNAADSDAAIRKNATLQRELELVEMDSKDKDIRFRKMADQALVGMFEVRADGKLTYANDSWYEMTGYERRDLENLPPLAWTSVLHEDDKGWFAEQWSRLTSGATLRFEIRFTKPYIFSDPVDDQLVEGVTWVAAAAYAEFDQSGAVKNVLGTTVDISRHKWMSSLQERQTSEAIKLKLQQEDFMDMTFHEVRNPLAAISICVESVRDTCTTVLASSAKSEVSLPRDIITATLDEANTAVTCVAHQKAIIDDVLTLAKINTGLLPILAVVMQPLEETRQALKMFEGEMRDSEIDSRFVVHPSYLYCKIDRVLLDPVRFRQILINLLANAVKFTKGASERKIEVTLAASGDLPRCSVDGIEYIQSDFEDISTTDESLDAIYLSVTVTDTGCGMDDDELANLFQRFRQGSPKTHVKYGGSGLGLFICKELAALQGGQMGIRSTPGTGSTLTFYVKAARCVLPTEEPVTEITTSVHGSSFKDLPQDPTHTHKLVRQFSDTSQQQGNLPKTKQRLQILLVEDNLVNQRVMAKQLNKAGFVVVVSNHGQEALDHLNQTNFAVVQDSNVDVILMDIEMPVMDGLECIRRIRETERRLQTPEPIPLIAVTANARPEQQTLALDAGFDKVVTKPFSMKSLLSVLSCY